MKTLALLGLALIIGFILRFANISPYKIYPDTYQNLPVTEDIAIFHL